MKIRFLLLFLVTLPMLSFGQKSIRQFYNKYENHENATAVNIQGVLIKAAVFVAKDFEGDDLVKKIKHLRVLAMENGNPVDNKDVQSLVTNLKKENFEDLMTIRDGTTNVRFLMREEKEKIKNILIIVQEYDEFVLVSLDCDISWKDLKNLDFNSVKGGQYLEKVPKTKKDVPRA